MSREICKGILFGITVGDALGVPVEFLERNILAQNPVSDMIGYGTHNQPAGTWSDDSSLTFCLAESLCEGYDLNDQARRFINWYEHAYWTPKGTVFDVGIATSRAIWKLKNGVLPTQAGGSDERSNGNGSLMRIMPLLFYIKDKKIEERFQKVKEVSSLTHVHIRSIVACFIYLEFALELLVEKDKLEALYNSRERVRNYLEENSILSDEEIFRFNRTISKPDSFYDIKPIFEYKEEELSASGYVLHTLESALWCFLNTDNYRDAVLKAVNLGSDTDTTGAVTGGLAGLYYGYNAIPDKWIDVLARKEDIEDLAIRLEGKYFPGE
jgi:ADP-ribosyl-[dinitrogen reductase] hydrolase